MACAAVRYKVHAFRRDELIDLDVTLQQQRTTLVISNHHAVTTLQRKAWLGH